MKTEFTHLSALISATIATSVVIKRHERTLGLKQKPDGTYVTGADLLAHDMLTTAFMSACGPGISILSEESLGRSDIEHFRPENPLHIIIDPIDGTSNFTKGMDDFSILVAVVEGGVPTHGIACFPAHGKSLIGKTTKSELHWVDHTTGIWTPVQHHAPANSQIIVPQRFIDIPQMESETASTQRLDFMQAATAFQQKTGYGVYTGTTLIWGSALPVLDRNIAARFYKAPVANQEPGDWDLATWDAILRAGGGCMTDLRGQALPYLQQEKNFKHSGFVCWRSPNDAGKFTP